VPGFDLVEPALIWLNLTRVNPVDATPGSRRAQRRAESPQID